MPVEYDVVEERFADELEVAVYYVASEALTNAAKHAEASVVRVTVAVARRPRWCSRSPTTAAAARPRAAGRAWSGCSDRVEALRGRLTRDEPARRGNDRARRVPAFRVAPPPSVEDFVENITRGNPGSVKAVLASVVLALATYQLILAAIGYRKLPVIDAAPAFLTHRASGDAIVVLFVLVALACVAAFGFEDDYALHGWAGVAAAVVVALKVGVVRTGIGGARAARTSASPCSRCWP